MFSISRIAHAAAAAVKKAAEVAEKAPAASKAPAQASAPQAAVDTFEPASTAHAQPAVYDGNGGQTIYIGDGSNIGGQVHRPVGTGPRYI